MPTLLETFGFKPAPAAQDVLDAATALREWNRDGRRTVPDDAPRAFVRRRWAPYVFGEHGIDRHYYELCAVSELRSASGRMLGNQTNHFGPFAVLGGVNPGGELRLDRKLSRV
jgi:hypothetical protein